MKRQAGWTDRLMGKEMDAMQVGNSAKRFEGRKQPRSRALGAGRMVKALSDV